MRVYFFLIKGSINVDNNILRSKESIGIWDTGMLTFECEAQTEFILIETPINQK